MRRTFRIIFVLGLSILFVAPMRSQDQHAGTPKLPELTAQRPECGLFMPMRDERLDVARLIRADQFVDCERDGYPAQLAPPWKEHFEAEKKLGEACEYFSSKSEREYPKIGQNNLALAATRCRLEVLQILLEEVVPPAGGPSN